MLFPALVTDLCQLSCLRTHSQVSSADQTLSYESHPRPTLLLGSMYIWTLLNQLSRSCNYIGENSWYWKRKKISDIRWCQNHRLSEGFHPLFPESVLTSLFQLEKWQKRVFQVWLSMALWPKTCPPPRPGTT